MPIISPSSYICPPGFGNGHVQTIFVKLFRKVPPPTYVRERIATPDGDFLDLDWARRGNRRLAVLCHGLEGSSTGEYIVAAAHAVNGDGWDALAWNYRGCSGESNHTPRYYHSGATDDLQIVIDHVGGAYDEIALIGYSLGGNLVLKYAGERGAAIDPRIRRVIAYSVPCDLRSSALRLSQGFNRVYLRRFLRSLKRKVEAKRHILPPEIHTRDYHLVRTFQDFDDRFTAPLHGFRDANDYWSRASSKQFIPSIRVPTLLVNARNDPFLTDSCLPFDEARANPSFFLEVPDSGGHVGFVTFRRDGRYWTELRALHFLRYGADVPMTAMCDVIPQEAPG